MLRALMNLVLLGLCYPLAMSAAEVTNGVNNLIVFASISGMHLSELSFKTLTMTVQEDASFYSVRASVRLTEDDYKALTRRRTFFDWWDSEKPSYDVWKGTVLLDGADDEFIPELSSVQYSIYIHNSTESVRRLYLLTSGSADNRRLYFYYVSTAQRVMPRNSVDAAAEKNALPVIVQRDSADYNGPGDSAGDGVPDQPSPEGDSGGGEEIEKISR